RIQWAGAWQDLPLWVRRNGRTADRDEFIQDRDHIEIRYPRTAAELREALGPEGSPKNVRCWVNGQPLSLKGGGTLLRNGVPARPEDPIQEGDEWDWEPGSPPTVRDALEELGLA